MSIPAEAVILVGGLGTRMGEMTKDFPKPMLKVQGKPFLEHTLVWMRDQGVKRFILATAHRSDIIEKHFKNGSDWKVEVVYSDPEGRQMGTGGSIKESENLIQGNEFFALNGDVRFEIKLSELYQFHQKHEATVSLALASVPAADRERYGAVAADADGKVSAFLEKKAAATLPKSQEQWINGGIYIFKRNVLDLMKKGEHYSLELDIFPKLVNGSLWGMKFPKAPFLDIGTPSDYERANR